MPSYNLDLNLNPSLSLPQHPAFLTPSVLVHRSNKHQPRSFTIFYNNNHKKNRQAHTSFPRRRSRPTSSPAPTAIFYTSLTPSEEPHPNNPFSYDNFDSLESTADIHASSGGANISPSDSGPPTASSPHSSSKPPSSDNHPTWTVNENFRPEDPSNPAHRRAAAAAAAASLLQYNDNKNSNNGVRNRSNGTSSISDACIDAVTINTSTQNSSNTLHRSSDDNEDDAEKSSDLRHRESIPTMGEVHDEIFFEGLSYPADVLEWCTTAESAHEAEIGGSSPNSSSTDIHPEKIPYSISPSSLRPSPKASTNVAVKEIRRSSPSSDTGATTPVCVGDHDIHTMRVEQEFVKTFRMSSPYINAHQGLIFVIHLPGSLTSERLFATVMEDIALMRVVGIKLVLVLGVQSIVNERLAREGIKTKMIDGIRVTDDTALRIIKELAGSLRFEVECALSKGVTNMPSHSRINVVSGTFFSAQPVGVIEGEDFGYTGKVRRVDRESITRRLDQGDIVIIPNLGTSPSGQQFNCKSEEVACACAAQLNAEKLIFMGNGETLYDKRNDHTIPNLTLKSAARFLQLRQKELPLDFRMSLQCSVNALEKGVRRAHILNRFMNGVLLMEVFHRDGVGLMVSRDLYEGFRRALIQDVSGMKAIIKPLEDQGILKPRSHSTLEAEIDKFVVIERDGMIIACMSLTQIDDDPTWAELGCVAVHRDYRKLGKGDAMLGFTERMAHARGVKNLFVLSTQSFDWFHERGFKEVSVEDLPRSRQAMYDRSRRSKIFYKVLQGGRAVDEAEVLKHL